MKRLTNKRNQIHRVWQGQPVAGNTIHNKAYTIEKMLHFINQSYWFRSILHSSFGQNRASVQLLMDFSPYKTNFIIIYIAIFKKSWNRLIVLIFFMRWLKRISRKYFGIFPEFLILHLFWENGVVPCLELRDIAHIRQAMPVMDIMD